MDRALELGINFFDTANVYGWKKGEGVTEQIVGRWFAQGGGRREKVVLATKVYGDDGRLAEPARGSRRCTSGSACEASLQRLKTDHIDLYQMHHVDRATPWDEIWQAMETLVAAGQGDLRRLVELRRLAHRAGERERRARATSSASSREQSLYNLNAAHGRARGAPRVPGATASACIPWSPLAGGLLGGALEKAEGGPARARNRRRRTLEKHRARSSSRRRSATSSASTPADVALAWLLANPVVTAPIIGPRTMEQLDGALRALEIELTPGDHAADSTRSSRARAAQRPRPTRGEGGLVTPA